MIDKIILVFLACLFAHYIADYILQTNFVARFKCKETWALEYPQAIYRNDYKAMLVVHSLSWSIVTFLPLYLMVNNNAKLYLGVIVINTIIHYIVDDLKANKKKISLIVDQLIHLIQILLTIAIYFL